MNEERKYPLLVVDDEPDVLESLSLILEAKGFEVMSASSGREALEVFSRQPVPVVICDNSLPDAQGIDLLKEFRDILPETQVIIVTGRGTIDIAVKAMKVGVFDFITKPADHEHLIQLARRARQLYDAMSEKRTLLEEIHRLSEGDYIGKTPEVKKLLRLVNTVAPTDSSVLVEGESGTGKELIARMIHERSPRQKGPFIAVDCGAIPEGLVESELFGHEKGAFTGAVSSKQGKFERADGGTLFLDEITNLPLQSQAKLLRVLQEKSVERVGGTRHIPVNIRLVAATNVSLSHALENKTFREDLYYRLNTVHINIPPLRDRKGDILLLCQHFIHKHREKTKSPAQGISKEALQVLMNYQWPGNVRELENVVEYALIMAKEELIQPQHFPEFQEKTKPMGSTNLEQAERDLIIKALKDSEGSKSKAAKSLGIPRSSLYSKLKKLDIS